ncbi:MAG: hypothetical protein M5U09_20310 [Gammaproteobacteria bacterium]|nr:hypothetical protein [Gammaproteobacteria bacterium]
MTAQSAARAGMRRLRLGATQQNAVLAVLTVVVAALVLGPVVVLVRASFTPADSMPLESWAVTLANFVTLLVSSSTARTWCSTPWCTPCPAWRSASLLPPSSHGARSAQTCPAPFSSACSCSRGWRFPPWW